MVNRIRLGSRAVRGRFAGGSRAVRWRVEQAGWRVEQPVPCVVFVKWIELSHCYFIVFMHHRLYFSIYLILTRV